MSETLTLDQAAELVADEAPPANIVPAEPAPESAEQFHDYSGTTESEEPDTASDGALTLEQAANIDLVDDRPLPPQARAADVPAVIIDEKPVTLKELVAGYRAAKNVDAHMANLSNQYAIVISGAHGIVDASWRLATLVADRTPAAPTPDLAMANPSQYVVQSALREAVDQFIEAALEPGEEARETAALLVNQRHHALLRMEFDKLAQNFPKVKTDEGRAEFFEGIRAVAYECGFSEDELKQVVDHRLFVLADLAREALEAREQRKVMAPKPRKKRRRSRHPAMEHLDRTGSIEAALAVDFD